MVRRGQYLERAVVIPGQTPLEGLYHRGTKRPGLVIAPPHPLEGGSMESTVVAELGFAATRAGHPTLRFNYRGVGASPGFFDPRIEANLAGLDQAIEHLAEGLGEQRAIAALGFGYGAEVVAHAALRGGVDPVILVSPDPRALPDLQSLSATLVIACGSQDPRLDRPTLDRITRSARDGRLVLIPEADHTFLRGLVQLGQVLAETLSPPGMLELS